MSAEDEIRSLATTEQGLHDHHRSIQSRLKTLKKKKVGVFHCTHSRGHCTHGHNCPLTPFHTLTHPPHTFSHTHLHGTLTVDGEQDMIRQSDMQSLHTVHKEREHYAQMRQEVLEEVGLLGDGKQWRKHSGVEKGGGGLLAMSKRNVQHVSRVHTVCWDEQIAGTEQECLAWEEKAEHLQRQHQDDVAAARKELEALTNEVCGKPTLFFLVFCVCLCVCVCVLFVVCSLLQAVHPVAHPSFSVVFVLFDALHFCCCPACPIPREPARVLCALMRMR